MGNASDAEDSRATAMRRGTLSSTASRSQHSLNEDSEDSEDMAQQSLLVDSRSVMVAAPKIRLQEPDASKSHTLDLEALTPLSLDMEGADEDGSEEEEEDEEEEGEDDQED